MARETIQLEKELNFDDVFFWFDKFTGMSMKLRTRTIDSETMNALLDSNLRVGMLMNRPLNYALGFRLMGMDVIANANSMFVPTSCKLYVPSSPVLPTLDMPHPIVCAYEGGYYEYLDGIKERDDSFVYRVGITRPGNVVIKYEHRVNDQDILDKIRQIRSISKD